MRAYRLSFDAKVGKFVIEFQGFLGIRWIKSQRTDTQEQFTGFNTYAEARTYVDKIGLDEVYEDFTKGPAWKQGARFADISHGYQPAIGPKWAVPPEFLKREGATS